MPPTTLPRITPKWLLLLMGSCFCLCIGVFIWMGCYAQPAKDDYLSAMLFRNKGLGAALAAQYRLHNGRLASALIMRYAPLQFHSFTGYKLVCIGFVLLFAGAMFRAIDTGLARRLAAADRLALFFAAYCCLHGALGNLAEFYYWLPAISCYGLPVLGLAVLQATLPRALAGSRRALLAAALGSGFMSLCSEMGSLMALGALFVAGFAAYRGRSLHKGTAGVVLLVIAGTTLLAALSPGNALRFDATPYTRSITAITAAALYAMAGNAFTIAGHLLPAGLLATLLLMRAGYTVPVRPLLFLLAGCTMLWLAAELMAVYALGGLPPLRLQHSILLLIAALVPAGLLALLERGAAPMAHTHARMLTVLAGCWIGSAILLPGHPFRIAAQELIAGVPQRYDREMQAVYRAAEAHRTGPLCPVPAVHEIPSSLYLDQPLVLYPRGWPYFHVQMANYFGCYYLYTDTLAAVPDPDAAFRRKLSSYRQKK